MYRTHSCGTLSQADENLEVQLAGWVDVRRDLGGVIFVELRDHTGRLQLVADPEKNPEIHKDFEKLRAEYCIQVKGKISNRPDGTENADLRTGAVEMYPSEIIILNASETLPLSLKDFAQTDEGFRLKNRHLDLRREEMQTNIRMRHTITQAIREYLVKEDFLEIETPILTLSTPEGARDYLVPSRVHPGEFYALPQSPQLFKQMLMSSGFEKYFQIAKCFRDEDLRADRQPEFTQVDIEQAFAKQEDIIKSTEGLIKNVFDAIERPVTLPFQQMDYDEAMSSYGSDKPDLRFDMKLIDYTDLMKESGFDSFAKLAKSGGLVKAICADTPNWTRKEFDDLRNLSIEYGAKGLAWITYGENLEPNSPIAKFFNEQELKQIADLAQVQENQSIFFVADTNTGLVHDVLGRLRLHLAKKLNLIDESQDNFVWIVNWPLFEKDEETGGLQPLHHPFTSPNIEDLDKLTEDNLSKIRTQSYDIVYNGVELGGGSIRIHNPEIQNKIFELLGITSEEIQKRFGFFMDALKYGAPPHGGIALGLDRLVMLLTNSDSLRQVIAFPKIQSATCPLTSAPSAVSEDQLEDLYLKVNKPLEI